MHGQKQAVPLEAIVIMWARDDGALDQDGGSEGGEKGLNSG